MRPAALVAGGLTIAVLGLGGRHAPPGAAATTAPAGGAVGLRVIGVVDPTRRIRYPGRPSESRRFAVEVRYPEARGAGPFPLVVFGHGYATTPAPYARLLRAWARAGFVVAAPVFPLENANAPGGPNESDLVNQPADMSLVITRLLADAARPTGAFSGLIDPTRVAVAGQSDGGETALAVAYDRPFRDPRVRAAVILSGAQLPGGPVVSRGGPPLLAVQGTADTVNPYAETAAFFRVAGRPKYLLTLIGAAHFPPYSDEEPQLGIVERVSIAFLDRYLGGGPLERLLRAGDVPGVARLTAAP